jgi:hypothetical protein
MGRPAFPACLPVPAALDCGSGRVAMEQWSPGAVQPPGPMPLRLTLSALEQASADPAIWRHRDVHRAVLISGLTTLVTAFTPIRRELQQADAAAS